MSEPTQQDIAANTVESEADARQKLLDEWKRRGVATPVDFDGWDLDKVKYTLENLKALPAKQEGEATRQQPAPQDTDTE
jgi:hypothetical protein